MDRQWSNRRYIGLFAALVLLCLAFIFLRPGGERGGLTATVLLDGQVLACIDLDAVREPYTLPAGAGNVVLVEPGRISMHAADCPDGLCLRQGEASPGRPVVCLPNRVIITVEAKQPPEYDAVSR